MMFALHYFTLGELVGASLHSKNRLSMFLTRGVRILCVRLLVVSLAVPLKVGLGAWSVDVMLPLDLNEIAYGETGVLI